MTGTPITPENAPPGTKLRGVNRVECWPAERIATVRRWSSPSNEYVIIDEACACGAGQAGDCWNPKFFTLADDLAPQGYKREGKPDYSLANRDMFDGCIRVLEFGCGKHGRDNYLTNPKVTDNEILAAARRHALEDPAKLDICAEHAGIRPATCRVCSGETHGSGAMANFAMLAHRAAARKRGEIK